MTWKLAWLLLSTLATATGFVVMFVLLLSIAFTAASVLGPWTYLVLALVLIGIGASQRFLMKRDPRKRASSTQRSYP